MFRSGVTTLIIFNEKRNDRLLSDLPSRPSDLASRTTKLIISNEEMNDIMKIVKSLIESGLLIKGVG